jgi:hypothetical protein
VEPRFFIDPSTSEPHVYGHGVTEAEVEDVLARPIEDRPGTDGSRVALMKQSKYPAGWDEVRVKRVLAHYEEQSDEEAVAEDEAAYESTTHTTMEVPVDLVPAVRELLAKRRAG